MPHITDATEARAIDKISTAPIAELKCVLASNDWPFSKGGEWKSYSDSEVREFMEDMLYEDYAYVAPGLKALGIKIEFDIRCDYCKYDAVVSTPGNCPRCGKELDTENVEEYLIQGEEE